MKPESETTIREGERTCGNKSRIEGFDEERVVDGVTFENIVINGVRMSKASDFLQVGGHVRNLDVWLSL